jgi:spermidine/putrescine transport system substrate-binding protein
MFAGYGKTAVWIVGLCALLALAGCGSRVDAAPVSTPVVLPELVFFGWPEDAIANVFPAFTQETGIQIRYVSYTSQEEAIARIRAGEVYDIVDLDSQLIPKAIKDGLLAPIDRQHVPHANFISPNFRDLAYDPGDRYTIPYSWGTTGIVVRTDLMERPVTRWADLWHPAYHGKVVLWRNLPRYVLGLTLQSLGYSVNSENPAELEQALDALIALKPHAVWLEDAPSSAPLLVSGDATLALGWAYDYWLAKEEQEAIAYVLPAEGTIQWIDALVIPANSPNQYAAELFLDFFLRPEISGQIVNANYYPIANDAARPYIDPALLADPVIYPPNDDLDHAEWLMPLSDEAEKLYAGIWQRFLTHAQ